jgi:hypothetical protein
MFNIQISTIMKKFRMMLPMVAFVFAMVGAVAGNFLPPVNAYYKIGVTCSTTTLVTEQNNCQVNLPTARPICTVNSGGSHLQAFADDACQQALRQAVQQ